MSGLLYLGGAGPVVCSMDIAAELLTQARARGIRSHLTNRAETLARTARAHRLADEVSAVDPDDPAGCVRWARERLAAGERFGVVLGLRDTVQLSVAHTAAALGVPGNPPDAVRRVRNKDACRQALAAAGFHQPMVRLCTNAEQAVAVLRETAGPWVIKPRAGQGSVGVRMVTDVGDVPAAIAGLPDSGEFLVEEYVAGAEFSVEGVFLGGRPTVLAVTAKDKLPPPWFVELGHVLPADLPDGTRAEIDGQVRAALSTLELRFGVFHVEGWLTGRGVVLGEVHVRPGGDWIHRLLGHAIPGLELFGLVLDDALGRPVERPPAPSRAAAARFLAPPPGRLVAVHGWDAVLAHPAVLHAELTVRPGAVLGPVRGSDDRAGVVVVGADTPAEARALASKLTGLVEFEVS